VDNSISEFISQFEAVYILRINTGVVLHVTFGIQNEVRRHDADSLSGRSPTAGQRLPPL
jgi:hypothetical protein